MGDRVDEAFFEADPGQEGRDRYRIWVDRGAHRHRDDRRAEAVRRQHDQHVERRAAERDHERLTHRGPARKPLTFWQLPLPKPVRLARSGQGGGTEVWTSKL